VGPADLGGECCMEDQDGNGLVSHEEITPLPYPLDTGLLIWPAYWFVTGLQSKPISETKSVGNHSTTPFSMVVLLAKQGSSYP